MEFLSALISQPFLQNALLAGLLASIGCGIMGTYVVVKRINFLAGGIAHSVLGGMGVAYFFGKSPIAGAIVAAIIAALVIGWVSLKWQENEDTIIAAIWSVGMAIGVIFIAKTPGYSVDLMSYLFGNILMVSGKGVLLMLLLDIFLVAIVMLFYKQLLAVCFDEEFARLRGVNVTFFYLLLLCMVALTVVLLIQVVGIILVIALLTLPAAIALQYQGSLLRIMITAVLLGAIFTSGGLALSYEPDLPAGATIILIAGSTYLLSTIAKGLLKPKPRVDDMG
ncbi:MAG: metal ABC transporter permease [Gammaproteobacteria bacterium]|nr:metal ABC transporter permease [Gammaproteobacteria bacterium]